MPLFERNNYQIKAVSELERRTRELEDKDKIAQLVIEQINDEAEKLSVIVDFSANIKLITLAQVEAYGIRMKNIKERAILDKKEYQDNVVDGYENPLEASERYMSMESYQNQIDQKKGNAEAKQTDNKSKIKEREEYERGV